MTRISGGMRKEMEKQRLEVVRG
eukprot:COSAG02_NODE_46270_length_350_cov_0.824701_2_plen_22_part_01